MLSSEVIHLVVAQTPAPLAASEADIIQMVLTAGPVVKLVLFLLLSFSVVSWAIIFMKFQMLRKVQFLQLKLR